MLIENSKWPLFFMHYNLPGGILVKAENAAKPASQPSKFMLTLLSELPAVRHTLDFGCGKLRYSDQLLETTQFLTLVDSKIQLTRQQLLKGKRTSVRDVYRGSNRVKVFDVAEFEKYNGRFDRAFCINVLSAIPILEEREKLLKQIVRTLQPGGTCLFVVQYRNSDFTRMARLPHARPWLDGFLLKSLRGYSFYALIRPEVLVEMVGSVGLEVVNQKVKDGSAYIWASVSDVADNMS